MNLQENTRHAHCKVAHDPLLADRLITEACGLLPQELRNATPIVSEWISQTLNAAEDDQMPLSRDLLKSLSNYFPMEFLNQARVIPVDRCPSVPLSEMGFSGFKEFEQQIARGITFRNCYFVEKFSERDASLHFHELVHTVQWQILGEEAFILTYVAGLLSNGYRNSPLEEMAFSLQNRFERSNEKFDTPKEIKSRLECIRYGF